MVVGEGPGPAVEIIHAEASMRLPRCRSRRFECGARRGRCGWRRRRNETRSSPTPASNHDCPKHGASAEDEWQESISAEPSLSCYPHIAHLQPRIPIKVYM